MMLATHWTSLRIALAATSAAMLLNACAPTAPMVRPDGQPPIDTTMPGVKPEVVPEVVPARPRIDTMADVPGDKPLPATLQGALERIDCKDGEEDLHARIAFEARGGKVANFAYYSKWKPRTCALDFTRTSPGTKWRLTPDGATRVHTPQGRFLIRTLADAYVFEFEQVDRVRYCGMPGDINGTMTIKRGSKPECSAAGILDANDALIENLRKAK